jgi:capsular exopolysaccharide synthesis family protein
LSLREYLDLVRRRRLVVLLVMAAAIVVGTVPDLVADPTYAATTVLQSVSEEASPFDDSGEQSAQVQARSVLTDAEVLQSSGMRARVAEQLGPDAQPFGAVSASVVGFSEVIRLRVTAASPTAAADAANAYADLFVAERRQQAVEALVSQSEELRRRTEDARAALVDIDRRLADQATDPVALDSLRLERSSLAQQMSDFSRRADQLEVEAALREGGIKVVSRAGLDLRPLGRDPLRSALIAAVLGLLAGLVIAVLLEVVQDRITSREDLDALDPEIVVLGAVPHTERTRPGDLSAAAMEAFRYLRTVIQFSHARTPIRALMVTSALSGEGKTTTATHLALALAETDQRVVLVDADIRRSNVHEQFGLENRLGLTSVLRGDVEVADAIHYVTPRLAVLTAGPASSMPSELLGSDDFADLIHALKDECDLLIIDAPPVLPVSDPLLVARVAGATIVVARLGVVRRRDVRAVLRRFRDASLPILGLVANDAELERTADAYYVQRSTDGQISDGAVASTRGGV